MEHSPLDSSIRKKISNGDDQVRINQKIGLLNEQLKAMTYGRKALIFVSVFTLLYVVMAYFANQDSYSEISSLDIILGGTISLIIYALAYWGSLKKPLLSFSLALAFYGLGIITDIIFDGAQWYRGILFKIAVIYFLIAAIQGAIKHKKLHKELDLVGLDQDRLDQAAKFQKVSRLKIMPKDE